MKATFEGFTITMTKDQAESIVRDTRPAVEALEKNPEIRQMLDQIDPQLIYQALFREYAARDVGGMGDLLDDDQENRLRILWIAGNKIREEAKY